MMLKKWVIDGLGRRTLLPLCILIFLSACVSVYDGVAKDYKKAASVRLELAANYFKINRFETALNELDVAIKLDSKSIDSFALRGLIYLTIGKIDDAQDSYDSALRLSPDSAAINNSYGWFLCQTGRESESMTHFQKAIDDPLYQTPDLAFQNAGICSLKLKKIEVAEEYLRKALEINRRLPEALLGLSKVNKSRQKWREANDIYRQYEELVRDPKLDHIWYGICIAYLAGNGAEVISRGLVLKQRFPYSLQYQAFLRRDFDSE